MKNSFSLNTIGLRVNIWKSPKLLKSAKRAVRNVDSSVYLDVTNDMLLIVHKQECFVDVSHCIYFNESCIIILDYDVILFSIHGSEKEIFNLYIMKLASNNYCMLLGRITKNVHLVIDYSKPEHKLKPSGKQLDSRGIIIIDHLQQYSYWPLTYLTRDIFYYRKWMRV